MKTFKIIFIIILFATGIAKAQNKVMSDAHKPDMERAKKCCPDTSSLISGMVNNFSNANLLIRDADISQDRGTLDYTFTATVVDTGDDCSYCTKIIVLLPAEVDVKSYHAVSGDGKKFRVTPCMGSLIIEADMMCPAAKYPGLTETFVHEIKITVITSKHTANVTNASFGIFAHSKIPDLVKENNFWSGSKP